MDAFIGALIISTYAICSYVISRTIIGSAWFLFRSIAAWALKDE